MGRINIGVFISNVTCVCVMYMFSLTGMDGFKDNGLWLKCGWVVRTWKSCS